MIPRIKSAGAPERLHLSPLNAITKNMARPFSFGVAVPLSIPAAEIEPHPLEPRVRS